MTRRDLIGRTLGTFVISHLPWKGVPVPHIDVSNQSIDMNGRIFRLFLLEKRDILRMISGVVASDINLEQPYINDIIFKQRSLEEITIELKFEGINILEQITYWGLGSVWKEDKNLLFPIKNFSHGSVACNNGDRLYGTHSIDIHADKKDIDKIRKVHEFTC